MSTRLKDKARRNPLSSLHNLLWGPIESIRLEVFTRVFSVCLLMLVLDRSMHPLEWLTSIGFHYSAETQSVWLPPPPPLLTPPLVPIFLAIYIGTTVSLIFGRTSRLKCLVLSLFTCYVTLADPSSAFTLNRLYTVVFLVLALAPRAIDVETAQGKVSVQSAWPVRIIQSTIMLQYFASGWCKHAHGDWTSKTYVLWRQSQGSYMTDAAHWALDTFPKPIWHVLQYGSLGFEFLAPVLLMVPFLRPIGIFVGVSFHLGIAVMMHKLYLFCFQMICFYILFLSTKKLESLVDRTKQLRSLMGLPILSRYLHNWIRGTP